MKLGVKYCWPSDLRTHPRLLGRTFSSYGADSAVKYKGGCVFVDHLRGYIHPELQAGFSSSETI